MITSKKEFTREFRKIEIEVKITGKGVEGLFEIRMLQE